MIRLQETTAGQEIVKVPLLHAKDEIYGIIRYDSAVVLEYRCWGNGEPHLRDLPADYLGLEDKPEGFKPLSEDLYDEVEVSPKQAELFRAVLEDGEFDCSMRECNSAQILCEKVKGYLRLEWNVLKLNPVYY